MSYESASTKSKKHQLAEQHKVVKNIAKKYYGDCAGFVKRFFPALAKGERAAWQIQEWEKYGELKDSNLYAYVGCTGCGKSTLVVMTCIWLVMTRIDPRIVVITSTGKQSETTIFDAIREYISKSPMAEYFDLGSSMVTLKCNSNKIKYFCFSEEDDEKGNALRGLHSTNAEKGITAIFLDEANKFGEWVYRKLTGIMADGNSLWVISSNGGAAEGGFYLRFSNPDYGFKARRITAWDIGMSEERIKLMAVNFGGVESEEYQHMICANFTGGEQSAITLREMEESRSRYDRGVVDKNDTEIYMGLDLSGKTSGKSKSCICVRNSSRVLYWQILDIETKELVAVVKQKMLEFNVKACHFDASGPLGSLFSTYANRERKIFPVVPHVLCKDGSEFLNVRSEIIFRMNLWIKINGEVPFDSKLYSLFGAVDYLMQSSSVKFGSVGSRGGKMKCTSKDLLEKTADKVTMDKFDALSYTFAADKTNIVAEVLGVKDQYKKSGVFSMMHADRRQKMKGGDPLKRLSNQRYF